MLPIAQVPRGFFSGFHTLFDNDSSLIYNAYIMYFEIKAEHLHALYFKGLI